MTRINSAQTEHSTAKQRLQLWEEAEELRLGILGEKGQGGGARQDGWASISKCKCERYCRCGRPAAPLIFCGKNCKVLGLHPAPPDTASHKTYSSYNHISANSLTRRTITLHFAEMWDYFSADPRNCSWALRGGRGSGEPRSNAVTARSELRYKRLPWQTNKQKKSQFAKMLAEYFTASPSN